MEQLYDPLRRKNVAATSEERVRQWFIRQLLESAKVPSHLMMSEAGFKFGSKQYRADILIFGRDGLPLAIVECKRPEIELTEAVLEQAMRYNIVLGVRWLFITNGRKTMLFTLKDGSFVPAKELPTYEGMLGSGTI